MRNRRYEMIFKCSLVFLLVFLTVACKTGRRGNRVSIDPFLSLQSNKAIKGEVGKQDEDEAYKERLTYGVKVNVDMFWILATEFVVARNQMESQLKAYRATDEFGEIDYEKDLNVDKSNKDLLLKVNEERRMARAALKAQIGLGYYFTAFAKVGAQAMQRIVKVKYTDEKYADKAPDPLTTPIEYDPYAGAGFRVRLTHRVQAGATYDFFFYKFPKYEPFTREVGVFVRVNF